MASPIIGMTGAKRHRFVTEEFEQMANLIVSLLLWLR